MHETRAGGVGGPGDRSRAFDVDGGVDARLERADDAREVDHGVDAGERIAERRCLERRWNDLCPRRSGVRRLGPDDGANIDAARDEVRRHVPADESGRAGHGHRQAHVSAF